MKEKQTLSESDPVEDINQLVKVAQEKNDVEREIKERTLKVICERTVPLFSDFEEKLFENLITLYAALGGLAKNEERDQKITGTLSRKPYGLRVSYKRFDFWNNNEYSLHVYLGNLIEKGLWSVKIKMLPKYEGWLKKKKRYIIKSRFFSKSYSGEDFENIPELRQRLEELYKGNLEVLISLTGEKDSWLKKYERKRNKDYEFLINVLKNLPKYVMQIYEKENKGKNNLLKQLAQK